MAAFNGTPAAPRVLVTGGAGFIGSHLVERLAANGHPVRVLDNFETGDPRNLDAVRDRVEVIEADVRDAVEVERAVRGCGLVAHLAALPSVVRSIAEPERTHATNATGTRLVAEAASDAGAARFVLASSSSVYGNGAAGARSEDRPPAPISPYGESKLAAEGHLRAAAGPMEPVILRFFNAFGPRQRSGSPYAAAIARFVDSFAAGTPLDVHGDGRQQRDFTYVANVVDAVVLALAAPGAGGALCNVGCGAAVSVNEIVQELRRLTGRSPEIRRLPRREGDIRHSLADLRRARELLGYRPLVPLRDGLRLTLEQRVAREVPAPAVSV